MSFENKYPYTDFHELNLDWFLARFKEVTNQVTTLDATVQQFTQFVTDYFDNLDVQQEINNKLDKMAADGSLSALIQPLFDEYKTDIDNEVSVQNSNIRLQNQRIETLEGRMDTFSSLTEGSTTGDAELMDIRAGYDGTVYASAGDAVRDQVEFLLNKDKEERSFNLDTAGSQPLIFENGWIKTDIAVGSPVDLTDIRNKTGTLKHCIITCNPKDVFVVNGSASANGRLYCFLDSSYNVISAAFNGETGTNKIVIAPENAAYAVFNDNTGSISYKGEPYNFKQNEGRNFAIYAGCEIVNLINRGNYQTNGVSWDPTVYNYGNNSTYKNVVLDCSEGDIFTIFGVGGSGAALLWAIVDSSNVILERASAGLDTTKNGAVVVIPENGNKIIIQCLVAYPYLVMKGKAQDIQKNDIIPRTGSITSTAFPPYITASNTKITLTKFINVYPGDVITVTPDTLLCRLFIWKGRYGNKCEKIFDTDYVSTETTFKVTVEGFFIVLLRKSDNSPVTVDDYDCTVSVIHGGISSEGAESNKLRIMTYNTGDFSGAGYTSGSEELAVQYRRAIGETKSDICFFQDDVQYFNNDTSWLPKDAVFGMFPKYYRPGNTSYNYMGFASDVTLANIRSYALSQYKNHRYIYLADLFFAGKTITLINVHFDWYDVDMRHTQINEVINYIEEQGFEYVIIAGDMNPSVRVNGDFPPGTSHNHNYSNASTDYAIWEAAGFKSGNASYFGNYMTDITYTNAEDHGDSATWDNIIVSDNISIKNVGVTRKDYMNDHAIFFADLYI